MRSGLSTILQTLTPEAASVLNHSIAEASRRNHGQTTPLHVAATLLSSPSGFLRQACIRSHPNSSHPLQCRALELCFSVALERLPTAQNMPPGTEPPISNALNAALKRAQANQRRGCPEQQQQPLLAVKVELEQLIISILDDPGVSRVMREASFSSPAVKATIEQTLNSSSNHTHHHTTPVNLGSFGGIGPRMLSNPASISTPSPAPAPPSVSLSNRNMYLNPRLQQGGSGQLGNQRNEELRKVLEILMRTKKKNPILVGEGEPEAVVKELLRRIEKGELGAAGEGPLKNVQVIPIDKDLLSDRNEIPMKIKELGSLIGSRIGNGGVILDLGDLKWLVEQPVSVGIQAQQQTVVSDASRTAVAEIGKLLAAFGETAGAGHGRIWLMGTATCETYLRCQVYHSTMENDWDLQAVPMASKSTNPGISPWLGKERLLSNPCESLSPLKTFPVAAAPPLLRCIPENLNLVRRTTSCPQCMEKYEQELAKLVSEFENTPSDANSDSARPTLPQWLQNAKQSNGDKGTSLSQSKDQELLKLKTQALQKKWSEKCLQLHPNFHHNVTSEKTVSPMLGMPSLQNPNLLLRQPLQPRLQTAKSLGETLQPKLQTTKSLGETLQPKLQTTKGIGESLQLNTNQMASRPPELVTSPPESPVRTELVLGQKPTEITSQKSQDDHVKDFLGCISLESEKKILGKFASALDADTYKKLLKGLMEKAWWQQDAASAVASAITRCRLGNGRQRGGASKGDIWLLFTGPDRIGKRKMASVLADQICGASPILISLGSHRDDEETEKDFRGKTAIDRIAEAVRRNPFSVIVLEDVDEANMLVRGNIKRAMERGRLTDSHGREISLGNIIFILTGNWSTINPESYRNENMMDDKKMASFSSGNWQLRLAIGEKSTKRGASWLYDEDRPTKLRKELGSGLGFDLNEAADADDRTDGSHNSSDLTIEHEEELGLENMQFSITSVPHELVSAADDSIVFRPVDFAFVRREIKKTISKKFSMVIEDKVVIEVEEDVVDRILAGLWRGQTSLEEWVQSVLAPSFDKLQPRLSSPHEDNSTIVRLQLEPDTDLSSRSTGDWLPSKVMVTAS